MNDHNPLELSAASATALRRFHEPVAPLPRDAGWSAARIEALLAQRFMARVQQAIRRRNRCRSTTWCVSAARRSRSRNVADDSDLLARLDLPVSSQRAA
jgi:hypothetical protein